MKRFPGLISYTKENSGMFFGRDSEIREISEIIENKSTVLLIGKSGVGKSSLINAGVVPEFEKNSRNFLFFNFRFTSNNSSIINSFFDQLNKYFPSEIVLSSESRIEEIWKIVKSFELKNRKIVVFIFDQFEEVFIHDNTFEIEKFAKILNSLNTKIAPAIVFSEFEKIIEEKRSPFDYLFLEGLRLKYVFSIRSDKVNELYKVKTYLPTIHDNEYLVNGLSKENAKNVLKQTSNLPKKINDKVQFDSNTFSISEEVLDSVTSICLNSSFDENNSEISTIQLQIIASEIENEVIKNNLSEVKRSNFDSAQISNSVRNFYNSQMDEFGELKDNVREVLEGLFIVNGSRSIVDSNILKSSLDVNSIEKLVNLRIIKEDLTSEKKGFYELSHDSLIIPIEEGLKLKEIENQELLDSYLKIQLLEKEKERFKTQRTRYLVIALITGFSFGIYYLWNEKNGLQESNSELSTISDNELNLAVNDFLSERFFEAKSTFLRIKNNGFVLDSLGLTTKDAEMMIDNSDLGLKAYNYFIDGDFSKSLELHREIDRSIPSRFKYLYPLLNDYMIKPLKEIQSTAKKLDYLKKWNSNRYLDIRNKELYSIPKLIMNYSILREINASGNLFESVPTVPLRLPFLRQYDLSDNKISQIDFELYNSNIEVLGLNSNQLEVLPAELFYMRNLKSINVNENKISFIENFNFKKGSLINSIALSKNPLGKFPKILVDSIPKLKTLILNNTYLEELPDPEYFQNSSLEKLFLRGNNFDKEIKSRYRNLKNKEGNPLIVYF